MEFLMKLKEAIEQGGHTYIREPGGETVPTCLIRHVLDANGNFLEPFDNQYILRAIFNLQKVMEDFGSETGHCQYLAELIDIVPEASDLLNYANN